MLVGCWVPKLQSIVWSWSWPTDKSHCHYSQYDTVVLVATQNGCCHMQLRYAIMSVHKVCKRAFCLLLYSLRWVNILHLWQLMMRLHWLRMHITANIFPSKTDIYMYSCIWVTCNLESSILFWLQFCCVWIQMSEQMVGLDGGTITVMCFAILTDLIRHWTVNILVTLTSTNDDCQSDSSSFAVACITASASVCVCACIHRKCEYLSC